MAPDGSGDTFDATLVSGTMELGPVGVEAELEEEFTKLTLDKPTDNPGTLTLELDADLGDAPSLERATTKSTIFLEPEVMATIAVGTSMSHAQLVHYNYK